MMKFDGRKIRRLRKQAGFDTQADFAASLGYASITVGRFERGEDQPMGVAQAIAARLEVPLDQLRHSAPPLDGEGLSDAQREVLEAMRRMGPLDQGKVVGYATALAAIAGE